MYNEIKSIKEPTEEDCYLGIIRVYQREFYNLEQENKQLNKKLKEKQKIIDEIEYFVSNEYIYDEVGMKIIDRSKLQDKIQELKEKYK